MDRQGIEKFIEEAKAVALDPKVETTLKRLDLEGKIMSRQPSTQKDDNSTFLDNEFVYFSTHGREWFKLSKQLIRSIIPISLERHDEYIEYRVIVELGIDEDSSLEQQGLFYLLRQVVGNLYDLSARKREGTVNWWRNANLRRAVEGDLSKLAPSHPSGEFSQMFGGETEQGVVLSIICSHLSCCAGCSSDCPRPTRTRGCPTKDFCTGKKAC